MTEAQHQRVFDIVFKALKTYAPGLTDTTRTAIATSVALQVTQRVVLIAPSAPVNADADFARRFDRRLK